MVRNRQRVCNRRASEGAGAFKVLTLCLLIAGGAAGAPAKARDWRAQECRNHIDYYNEYVVGGYGERLERYIREFDRVRDALRDRANSVSDPRSALEANALDSRGLANIWRLYQEYVEITMADRNRSLEQACSAYLSPDRRPPRVQPNAATQHAAAMRALETERETLERTSAQAGGACAADGAAYDAGLDRLAGLIGAIDTMYDAHKDRMSRPVCANGPADADCVDADAGWRAASRDHDQMKQSALFIRETKQELVTLGERLRGDCLDNADFERVYGARASEIWLPPFGLRMIEDFVQGLAEERDDYAARR